MKKIIFIIFMFCVIFGGCDEGETTNIIPKDFTLSYDNNGNPYMLGNCQHEVMNLAQIARSYGYGWEVYEGDLFVNGKKTVDGHAVFRVLITSEEDPAGQWYWCVIVLDRYVQMRKNYNDLFADDVVFKRWEDHKPITTIEDLQYHLDFVW